MMSAFALYGAWSLAKDRAQREEQQQTAAMFRADGHPGWARSYEACLASARGFTWFGLAASVLGLILSIWVGLS
jgi:hypothetical protein